MFRLNFRREMPERITFRSEPSSSQRTTKFHVTAVVGTHGGELVSIVFDKEAEFNTFITKVSEFKQAQGTRRRYDEAEQKILNDLYNNLFTLEGLYSKTAVQKALPFSSPYIYEMSVYKEVGGQKYGAIL